MPGDSDYSCPTYLQAINPRWKPKCIRSCFHLHSTIYSLAENMHPPFVLGKRIKFLREEWQIQKMSCQTIN